MNLLQSPPSCPEIQFQFTGFQRHFFIHEHPFLPIIDLMNENPFSNVQIITLEAGLKSSLDWKKAEEEAACAIEKGKWILWEFKLGLFHELTLPLTDEGQYLSLSISIEHFKKTLWEKFKQNSFGALLYQDSLDFSLFFPWNPDEKERFEEWLDGRLETPFLRSLYCLNRGMEFLTLFASCLPEGMIPFVFLKDTGLFSLAEFFQLTSRENYPHFHLAIQSKIGERFLSSMPVLEWVDNQLTFSNTPQKVSLGICLPSNQSHSELAWKALEETVKKLSQPFRLFTELYLTQEWDGIDHLIVFSDGISAHGKRKLLGFCAAGGEIIVVGEPLSLPSETSIATQTSF